MYRFHAKNTHLFTGTIHIRCVFSFTCNRSFEPIATHALHHLLTVELLFLAAIVEAMEAAAVDAIMGAIVKSATNATRWVTSRVSAKRTPIGVTDATVSTRSPLIQSHSIPKTEEFTMSLWIVFRHRAYCPRLQPVTRRSMLLQLQQVGPFSSQLSGSRSTALT